ncbi:YcjX family protein [Corallincola luteus]|uniref:YcjX family protein n=1 Tax=Corallincola luteus TaxID=1775177 RepID=A0ABY2AGE4_9GAMM|nr:YcjX family protein [Corallincola luteus]TCI01607.1 YcjX family protein [Corallincola luteus]
MKKDSGVGRWLDKVSGGAQQAFARSLDRHLVLAVTGLSGAGKSAFITSLLFQLINFRDARLPFFKPCAEQRLLAVRRIPQQRLDWVRYPYENSLTALSSEPPCWPEPTKGVSTVSLELAYRPTKQPLATLTNRALMQLDIVDYPGEWLLDLPLLELDYRQWCELFATMLPNRPEVPALTDWKLSIDTIDLDAPADEFHIAEVAQQYAELLQAWRCQGAYLLQPGRFVLPGEYENTPLLHFFPLMTVSQDTAKFNRGSVGEMLEKRFEQYKSKVVKRFYKDYFSRFDRQIVLVDPLTALGAGHNQLLEMQQALLQVLGSFRYGRSSIIRRLFSPKIEKVMLAATKADHVTPEQHEPLKGLIRQLLLTEENPWAFSDIAFDCITLASIRASNSGKSQLTGGPKPMLKGVRLSDREEIITFPGEVPASVPSSQFFNDHQFSFVPFAPPVIGKSDNQVPHIAMDRVLQFLLGDKLQ